MDNDVLPQGIVLLGDISTSARVLVKVRWEDWHSGVHERDFS